MKLRSVKVLTLVALVLTTFWTQTSSTYASRIQTAADRNLPGILRSHGFQVYQPHHVATITVHEAKDAFGMPTPFKTRRAAVLEIRNQARQWPQFHHWRLVWVLSVHVPGTKLRWNPVTDYDLRFVDAKRGIYLGTVAYAAS